MPSPGSNEINVLVGLTSTPVLGSSPRRRKLYFNSPPANRITLSFGEPAVLDQGNVTLYPGLRPVTISLEEAGTRMQDAIFAITTVAAQQLSGQEQLDFG